MKRKLITVFVLALVSVMIAFAFTACGDTNPSESDGKTVKSIAVKTMPKTEYVLGEEFSAEGGVLTVTYTDGSTEEISMTAEGVEITVPDMTLVGEDKNVIVYYGEKRATYRISVKLATFTVTFDYGDSTDTAEVNDGETVAEPETPVRTGYTFDGWYTAEAGGLPFDFDTKITSEITLYAYWLDDNATYYNFTFDYNDGVGGIDGNKVVQKVVSGENAVELVTDPTRTGYSFLGWFTAKTGGTEYDFDAAVTSATTVYAQWERTSYDRAEYVFEVEDIVLEDPVTGATLTGPGASGTGTGSGMLVADDGTHGVSNGYFISFLYRYGIALQFEIVSDMYVENAQLVVRMSAEGRDRSFSQDNYAITVNATESPAYSVEITDVPAYSMEGTACAQFRDVIIGNVTLYEGRNYVTLMTNNNDGDAGSTRTASAPLIDCIKITTEAILTWNTSLGYPAENY